MADEVITSETTQEEAPVSETPTVEATQSAPETVKAEGRTAIEQKILERLSGKKSETETLQPEKNVEKEKPQAKTHDAITDDDVKEFPALKSLIGKPYGELIKAYENMNKAFSKSQSELSQLKKQKPELSKQEIKPQEVETKTIEQQIDELIEKADLPDSIDDPKSYNKALIKLNLKIMALENEAKNAPIKQKLDELGKDKEAEIKAKEFQAQQEKTINLVSKHLEGETFDMEKLGTEFQEFIEPIIAEQPDYYFGKPELLASDIARYFKSEKSKKLEEQNNELTEKLKNNPKGATVADLKRKIESAPKENKTSSVVHKEKTLTPVDQLNDKILRRMTGEGL